MKALGDLGNNVMRSNNKVQDLIDITHYTLHPPTSCLKFCQSHYLVKVQVHMVEHVNKQKYSGNLQKEHLNKHVE